MIRVATFMDKEQGYYPVLKERLLKWPVKFDTMYMDKFSWRRLVEAEIQYARDHKDDYIIFVDAWDMIPQLIYKENLEWIQTKPLLYHSEKICWPQPHKADAYTTKIGDGRFRFVNGTGPAGKGAKIEEALSYAMRYAPIVGDESSVFADNDQRLLTDAFLAGYGEIDTGLRLSVQMNAVEADDYEINEKVLRVKETGSVPLYVHANGASKYSKKEDLDRLCGFTTST